ncbi:hypothetical protein CGC20_27935 [Leishmania donovani]|uniref:Uncharacterized protein n=1 Tax=Leishmania donovani TaxID=5661 RepID=A0A504X332_LEIDO|nr:hypothetical protein CGC20_27935 [Leishmania donovani]
MPRNHCRVPLEQQSSVSAASQTTPAPASDAHENTREVAPMPSIRALAARAKHRGRGRPRIYPRKTSSVHSLHPHFAPAEPGSGDHDDALTAAALPPAVSNQTSITAASQHEVTQSADTFGAGAVASAELPLPLPLSPQGVPFSSSRITSASSLATAIPADAAQGGEETATFSSRPPLHSSTRSKAAVPTGVAADEADRATLGAQPLLPSMAACMAACFGWRLKRCSVSEEAQITFVLQHRAIPVVRVTIESAGGAFAQACGASNETDAGAVRVNGTPMSLPQCAAYLQELTHALFTLSDTTRSAPLKDRAPAAEEGDSKGEEDGNSVSSPTVQAPPLLSPSEQAKATERRARKRARSRSPLRHTDSTASVSRTTELLSCATVPSLTEGPAGPGGDGEEASKKVSQPHPPPLNSSDVTLSPAPPTRPPPVSLAAADVKVEAESSLLATTPTRTSEQENDVDTQPLSALSTLVATMEAGESSTPLPRAPPAPRTNTGKPSVASRRAVSLADKGEHHAPLASLTPPHAGLRTATFTMPLAFHHTSASPLAAGAAPEEFDVTSCNTGSNGGHQSVWCDSAGWSTDSSQLWLAHTHAASRAFQCMPVPRCRVPATTKVTQPLGGEGAEGHGTSTATPASSTVPLMDSAAAAALAGVQALQASEEEQRRYEGVGADAGEGGSDLGPSCGRTALDVGQVGHGAERQQTRSFPACPPRALLPVSGRAVVEAQHRITDSEEERGGEEGAHGPRYVACAGGIPSADRIVIDHTYSTRGSYVMASPVTTEGTTATPCRLLALQRNPQEDLHYHVYKRFMPADMRLAMEAEETLTVGAGDMAPLHGASAELSPAYKLPPRAPAATTMIDASGGDPFTDMDYVLRHRPSIRRIPMPDRVTQARHVMLLSNDAPVLNRCAKEEAHLKHRLAQSTAAFALTVQKSHAAAAREERSRESRLQAQFTALLSGTPGVVMPPFVTPSPTEGFTNASERASGYAATGANNRSVPDHTTCTDATLLSSLGLKSSSTVAADGSATPAASLPCALGFPEAYESSGFKSAIHWASVAHDETFLTAYGPRRIRKEAQTRAIAGAGGSPAAREAMPHRLMTSVACYLLNQVLCADAAVSELWREKLRQPIFDAIFSSQSIAMGHERSGAQRSGSLGDAAVTNAIVHRTLGPASSLLSGTATHSDPTMSFPPRTNEYATRHDFASLRLWTEEVTLEHLEKTSVCQRVRNLQNAMARRQIAVHLFQRRAHQAELQAVFTVWRTYTQQRRASRSALERYLVKRNHRHVVETVFLRWRRFSLRSKVEAVQRRLLNIAADRDCAARKHATALHGLQDQLASERRQHVQETFERDTLHAQMLESHAVEIEALQLMLQMERLKTAQSGKWAMRWERVAKTFRPAKPCPAVPRPIWTLARTLLSAEEELAATILKRSRDERVLLQIPYSMILQARRRLEQLLLAWVNVIMEASPQASTWVTVEAFTQGRSSHPRGILLSHKQPSSRKAAARRSGATAGAVAAGKDDSTCEFSIYTLMCLVRELRRCYAKAGLIEEAEDWGTSDGVSVADCYQELTHLFAAQSCGGLYPPLLVHCPTSPFWFTPEGVFGGPVSHLEGSKRQKREQHTTFTWLLASLLVGHIQIMRMLPLADMGVPPGRLPMKGAATLRCKHEAEVTKLARISFPRRCGAPPAGSTAAPRGTSVVASSTLLPKKRSVALPAASSSRRAAAKASMASAAAAGDVEGAGVATTEMTLEALLRARFKATHDSTSSDGRRALAGKDLTDAAEDSLSDIEVFLGMAQQRRTKRLQGSEFLKDGAEDGHARSAAAAPASALGDNEEGEGGSRDNDAAAAADTASTIYGDLLKSTVVLTGDQLRLLRSLPGRSHAFDTLRPIAIAQPEAASVVVGLSKDHSSTASYASAAPLYSFLLNTLDDTVARQQWSGLARVVTSLVVRFHVLDESEDAVRQAAVLTPEEEESEELRSGSVSRRSPAERAGGSPPLSTTRLPPVSVGCAPSVAAEGKGGDGAAVMASPRSGGRIAAQLHGFGHRSGIELRRRGAYQTNSARKSFSFSSPIDLSAQGAQSPEPSSSAAPPISIEASEPMAPPPSEEYSAQMTSKDGNAFRPPMTANAGATAGTAYGIRTDASAEVLAGRTRCWRGEQGAGHAALQISVLPSPAWSYGTAQWPSECMPEEYPAALVHASGAFRRPTRTPPHFRPMALSSAKVSFLAIGNMLSLRRALPVANAFSLLHPNKYCLTATGTYSIPQRNSTLQTPRPSTLPAAAPVLGCSSDPMTAP